MGWGTVLAQPAAELPPYPGYSLIRPAELPPYPHLRPEAEGGSPAEWVQALRAAYLGMLGRATGRRIPTRTGKWRETDVECARAMIEHRVRPGSWCRWSFGVWREIDLSKQGFRLAPQSFVWSADRVARHHGWFHSEEEPGAQVIIGEAHRELLRLWYAVERDAMHGVPVRDALARHLPGRVYQDLVQRAREEALTLQDKIDAAVARGEWVWR